jgi:hypothetical protein
MKTKINQKTSPRWMTGIALCLTLCLGSHPSLGNTPNFRGKNPVPEPVPLELRLPTNATSAEIQQALDQLPASGGVVDLPSGIFTVTQPIVLQRDNQTLRGAGPSTILRLAAGADCPVIILGQPVNYPRLNVRHLCLADLQIDGNRHLQSRELWKISGEGSEIRNNGVTIQHVSDSLVDDVICARCRSGGLVTTLDVNHLTVRKLTSFDNEFDGLACYETRHSTFTDLFLHDNPGAGISLDLAFNENSISNAFLLGNNLGVFMRASRDNQFYNVTIQNSHHFGVFMAGHLDQDARTECADNAFTNLSAANCGGPAFRVNNVTCTNNILIGAKFAKNLKGGLSLARPNLVTLE